MAEMKLEEALRILGVRKYASRDEIKEAYRRRAKKIHPDMPGGSEEKFKQITKARDVLLGWADYWESKREEGREREKFREEKSGLPIERDVINTIIRMDREGFSKDEIVKEVKSILGEEYPRLSKSAIEARAENLVDRETGGKSLIDVKKFLPDVFRGEGRAREERERREREERGPPSRETPPEGTEREERRLPGRETPPPLPPGGPLRGEEEEERGEGRPPERREREERRLPGRETPPPLPPGRPGQPPGPPPGGGEEQEEGEGEGEERRNWLERFTGGGERLSWWERHRLFSQIIEGLLIWWAIIAIGWVVSNIARVNIIGNFWWFMIGGFMWGFSTMEFSTAPAYSYSRAAMRGIAIYFLGWAFFVVYKIVGLLVTFFGFMTLPTRIRGGAAFESALASIRFLVGGMMTYFVFMTIGGAFWLKLALTLITGGFFATLPEISMNTVNSVQQSGAKSATKKATSMLNLVVNAGGGAEDLGSKMMSAGFCFLGTIIGIIYFATAGQGAFPIATFAIFGTVASVTAFTTPAQVRGIAGMPYVLVIFLVTGVMFPGVVGEAFFGGWWPTIQTQLQSTFGPAVGSMNKMFGTFRTGFQCLTNPVECAKTWRPGSTTEKTIEAVELLKVTPLVPTIKTYPSQSNPVEVRSIIEIENKGERTARNIQVKLLEPKSSRGKTLGIGKKVNCGEKKGFDFGTTEEGASCTIDKLYSGEPRRINAVYKITGGDISPGEYADLGAKILYTYSVNSTVDVEVWDSDYFDKIAQTGGVNFKEVLSKDTGGVVGLGISVMRKQPVRDNLEDIPLYVSIENRGNGKVEEIEKLLVNLDKLTPTMGKRKCVLGNNFKRLKGNLPVEPTKSIRDVCSINLRDVKIRKKTFGLTAFSRYKYSETKYGKVKLSFSAIKCKCENGEAPEVYTCEQCEKACVDKGGVEESVVDLWKELFSKGASKEKYGACV